MDSIQASSRATTGITVVSSKNGAYVAAVVMSGTSVSTMLMNVFPSTPAQLASVPGAKPAFENTSSAFLALSTPGASLPITTYFTIPPAFGGGVTNGSAEVEGSLVHVVPPRVISRTPRTCQGIPRGARPGRPIGSTANELRKIPLDQCRAPAGRRLDRGDRRVSGQRPGLVVAGEVLRDVADVDGTGKHSVWLHEAQAPAAVSEVEQGIKEDVEGGRIDEDRVGEVNDNVASPVSIALSRRSFSPATCSSGPPGTVVVGQFESASGR